MKKALLLSCVLGLFSLTSFAGTGQYKLDDASVDALFEQSTDVTASMMTGAADLSFTSFAKPEASSNAIVMSDKSPITAFLLAFFLGFLGIHRFYLGTKTMTGVGYILTCGGLGVVAFVDWILLLIGTINDDIDKYVDNPKFFMW
jgi:TM2 domain-containing membrane protein YozV